jgi:hypothetical protein
MRSSRRCVRCESEFVGGQQVLYCGSQCRAAARSPKQPKAATKVTQYRRSPLRLAVEAGEPGPILQEILKKSEVDQSTGCWVWQGTQGDGYPLARFGQRDYGVHRLALEAWLGAPLGSQHAHHKCAVTLCVNPTHLQPVTHRENAAEMLARNSYLARIRELEHALSLVDPQHPLLNQIGVA